MVNVEKIIQDASVIFVCPVSLGVVYLGLRAPHHDECVSMSLRTTIAFHKSFFFCGLYTDVSLCSLLSDSNATLLTKIIMVIL